MSEMKKDIPKLEAPHGETNILLHTCCAPCSCDVIDRMLDSGITPTMFFYNPNIHPKKEYELRKAENMRYAEKRNLPIVDADYDVQNWFSRAKGMEWEPEKGKRCTMCFDMRFERTALYAHENGFNVFTSSLGISRWKNIHQINSSGERAASHYPNLTYWTYNWKKFGGAERMYDIAKEEEFYQQQYCGCIFSLRDQNTYREGLGREQITIGETWYEDKLKESSN
ncbi:MAG: epoxyqueuosine reductase QueH [Pseudobdellovibrionaceae bacterium]